MAEDSARRGARDRTRVDLEEECEVRYWMQEFGVTEEELRHAVHTAGVMIDDVREQLRRT